MAAIHIEFTEYYFPDGKDFPSKNTFYDVMCRINIIFIIFILNMKTSG